MVSLTSFSQFLHDRQPETQQLKGQKVVLHSLQATPELNGEIATCIGFDEVAGRLEILLEIGETKRVRPANIARMASCASKAGMTAVLHSLTGDVELNGQVVTCSAFTKSTGRWLVTLQNGEQKNVRLENLAATNSSQSHVFRKLVPQETSHTNLSCENELDSVEFPSLMNQPCETDPDAGEVANHTNLSCAHQPDAVEVAKHTNLSCGSKPDAVEVAEDPQETNHANLLGESRQDVVEGADDPTDHDNLSCESLPDVEVAEDTQETNHESLSCESLPDVAEVCEEPDDRIWAKKLNEKLLAAQHQATAEVACQDSLSAQAYSRPPLRSSDSFPILPPLVCLPSSSNQWGECQFSPDDPDAEIYASHPPPQRPHDPSGSIWEKVQEEEANACQYGLEGLIALTPREDFRKNRTGFRLPVVEELNEDVPQPSTSSFTKSVAIDTTATPKSCSNGEIESDSVKGDSSSSLPCRKDASKSRSRSRTPIRSQRRSRSWSPDTPSPIRDGTFGVPHVSRRRTPSPDEFDDIPFPLFVPGSGNKIQCDGCGKWIEDVHNDIIATYGRAANCPFYCSCLGLPKCDGEDSDIDDLGYFNLVKQVRRVRNRREKKEN